MKVNEKFPNWITSGGLSPQDFTGFVSNIVYPYFYAQDKPTFRYPYSSNVFPSITVGQNAYWLSDLDMLFATRFGERELRSFVKDIDLHNDPTKSITADQINNSVRLAQAINLRYGDKWNHIADTLAIEYAPLENYDMNDQRDYQHSNTGIDSDVKTFTGRKDTKKIDGGWSDSDTRSLTKGGKTSTDRVTNDNVFGFDGGDSGTGKPSEYHHETETVDYNPNSSPYSETNGGAIERTYKGKANTQDPYTETYENLGSETNTHNINNGNFGWEKERRHGNLGVTTSQQMAESEFLLRARNLLYDIIINDIAEFLTISIY